MTTDWDGLDEARRRLPIGHRVTGTVHYIPRAGTIGIFIDLGDASQGFVDVTWLPADPARWPSVGTVAGFEVLQHRRAGQVRLWPLDGRWRTERPHHIDDAAWAKAKSRYHPGQVVSAQTTDVFTSNREYAVAFDDQHAVLEWSTEQPTVGSSGDYRIMELLDTTRRILLQPVAQSTV
jgi:hypothetical protein